MDDDGDDKDDTKRRTRNLSEKKRRDQFNLLVNELSTMVSTNNRKMDKSTVLKATISFLRNHNEITVRSRAHDVQDDWKPSFLSNEEFTYLVLESLEGFVMVFSASGRIHYVSESITSLLGYNPADIISKSIFELAYEGDRPSLYNLLQNPGSATDISQIENENEIRFQCHFKRTALDIKEETTYELIEFNGHFRTNVDPIETEEAANFQSNHDSRLLFVCTGRLYTPQLIRDVSLVDSNRSEFTSRHSLEWKFLFLDHRAPPIIGYLPFEVLGTSGYDYYHFDDLEKVINCHESLMQKGELTSCYYRFLTKGQQWIWLQSRFFITYHQWNSKPEFVVCNNRVVSYSDVISDASSTKQEVEADDAESLCGQAIGDDSTGANSGLKESLCDEPIPAPSPSYISETSDPYPTFQPYQTSYSYMSEDSEVYNYPDWRAQMGSVKSLSGGSTTSTVVTAVTSGATWSRLPNNFATESLSGDSRESQQTQIETLVSFGRSSNASRTSTGPSSGLIPPQGIGAQYLEPAPFMGTVSLQPLPMLVTSDRHHHQEQLQRKHEDLQRMILRQQEELRLVKEQLLMARLGLIQPLVSVPPEFEQAPADEGADEPPPLPESPLYESPPGPPHHPHSQHHHHPR